MHFLPEASETTEEIRAIVALSLVPGIGSARVRTLVSHFGSALGVFEASAHELACIDGIGRQTAQAVRAFNGFRDVDRQIEQAERVQARLITYWSSNYPERLRSIFDPPAFVWLRGRLQAFDRPLIAIVGTRRPTFYGKKVAEEFAAQLVQQNFTIVSGLAYGIDACAHKAALDAGGETIAVLGSGVDMIYPTAHNQLAQEIINWGCILSELPLNAKPDAANFPRRNRIISGLSLGTLVVEGYEKGGALITARMAVEQNREVFAIPGSIFSPASKGMHQLIQRGHAKLVHTVHDILEEFNIQDDPGRAHTKEERLDTSELNSIEKQLYDVLTHEPLQIDTICEKANVDPSTALVYLLSLEFKGLIYQMAGKQFYRV